MCLSTVVDHLKLYDNPETVQHAISSVSAHWNVEYVVVVWWKGAICMVADSSVWLVVAPQYLMLLTTCVRPAHGPHNTVTHFYAFPAYIIRKFSPLNCSSACLPLLVILFGLWHHLPYCGARWSFRTHVHDMCTQVCLCPVSFYSDWVCSTMYYICIHIRIRYYLSASCARHARPICPMQHWTAYSVRV